jgi:FdrA protein
MSVVASEIRPGAYADSIVLMQLQSALAAEPDVLDAGVVMGTEANLELLAANALRPDSLADVGADDLLVVVRAESEEAARAALSRVDKLLERGGDEAGQDFRPRGLDSAVKLLPDSRWVMVSVPGRWAARVARESLDLGRNVFLYSDNVSVEEEVALKRVARDKGLLVMGPDCGTALVGGVGMGFANRVRRGDVGLVGASGTGLQAITSRLHQLGGGVSHALGTGGRDLSSEVGGVTALQAVDLLARDPETKTIVLVSKPPAPEVAARLLAAARATGKPVVVNFQGFPAPARRLGNLRFAGGLSEAADLAVEPAAGDAEEVSEAASQGGFLRGLFAGGTLAYEAVLALRSTCQPLWSNLGVSGARPLTDPANSRDHTLLDLGSDEYTVGRLHPMMDQDLRLRRLRQEAADPEVGLVLLDVVLGEGSHPDPAAELAPAIGEIKKERDLDVVVMVVGTDEDPQDLARQRELLGAAGAEVFDDVASALARVAGSLTVALPEPPPPVPLDALAPPAAINAGLESFYASLVEQGGRGVQMDWRPPAGGDEEMIAILDKMRG